MTRSVRVPAVLVSALLIASVALAGCSQPASSGGDKGAADSAKVTPIAVRIGTLPTEDSLPLWVAEKAGYFAKEGIPKVEIVEFQSAQERDVAFASGSIDGYMGDLIAAANLTAAGKPNTIATVMLGADKTQGRFGIAFAPQVDNDTTVITTKGLANVPVGTSSATIQEYVLDGLMAESGVPTSAVKVEEVKKVPVRFQLLMSGKLRAAALPEPFLSLAEQGGAKVVADDTKAKTNLSQTILAFSAAFWDKPGGSETIKGVLRGWDSAVADINKAPESYRALLVEKAKLPKSLESSYKVNTYPEHQLPAKEDIAAVLAWMDAKGYLKGRVTPEQLTAFTQ